MKSLLEIIDILRKSNYLDIETIHQSIKQIKFLPLGSILQEKIKTESHGNRGGLNIYLMNTNENCNISEYNKHKENSHLFLSTSKFRENFLHVKNNFQKDVPFGIKEDIKFMNTPSMLNTEEFTVDLTKGTLISCTYFVNESTATEYFYKIQRERKIWWMKFSPNPGRYFLSDLTTKMINNQKTQSVRIKSKFNFGELGLESVDVIPLKALALDNQSEFSLKDTRLHKRVIPAVIRSEICLETAVLGILMDAVEDTRNSKIGINRKIAPYQCSIFCLSEELEDLATHLANVFRNSGISTLNLRKCYTNCAQMLQKELHQMDRIGVPYCIILEPDTLSTGLMKLRNRDTTISEVIHVTDVPDYLVRILNS